MLRRALGLLWGAQDSSSLSAQVDAADRDFDMGPAHDSSAAPCFFLDTLPPEIRVHIYGYLILSEHRLVPYSNRHAASARTPPRTEALGASKRLDLSIFQLNKQIYAEATDIFYTFNKFATHYEDFCSCWSGKHISLNKPQIRRFKIKGINFDEEDYPRLWSRCRICDTQAYWLVKYLSGFPKLDAVTMAFEDVESFALCLGHVTRKLRRLGKTARLETEQIGRVFVTGIHTRFELRLPSLIRTWPSALAKATEPGALYYDSDEDVPGCELRTLSELDTPIYLALRDIMYHAISAGSTSEELEPLMRRVVSPGGLKMACLDTQEKAEFTLALAECLADIIADDENVHMADRRDLVPLSDIDADENKGRSRASSAVSRRPYSYITRF